MKFFIDTANIAEIKEAVSLGLIDGVTTNPSLVSKENREFRELIKEVCSIVDGPVSAEVISLDAGGMVKEARELSSIHKNIVVKIPMTPEGLKAVKTLSQEGVKTYVILARQFAAYVAAAYSLALPALLPFGRLDDVS